MSDSMADLTEAAAKALYELAPCMPPVDKYHHPDGLPYLWDELSSEAREGYRIAALNGFGNYLRAITLLIVESAEAKP